MVFEFSDKIQRCAVVRGGGNRRVVSDKGEERHKERVHISKSAKSDERPVYTALLSAARKLLEKLSKESLGYNLQHSSPHGTITTTREAYAPWVSW
jgi:hypothetical protein